MKNYLNVIIFVIVFVLIGNVANSKRITSTIDDGLKIKEIELIVEGMSEGECVTTDEIKNEIKYTFYNSNINISEDSPYRLYVNVNLAEMRNKEFCFGDIEFQIYSYTWEKPIKKILHWDQGTIQIKSHPWKVYILETINENTKKAIVWMNEN